ncbi:MAG: protein kinase domain-containing protein [Planctomycetaceae bacterium]
MNDRCSIELLKNAVSHELSSDEEAALHDHLEHCDFCCAQMEHLVGGQAWQQEAASLLTADELDEAVSEAAAWSEEDFSVGYLDPSDDANVLGRLDGYDVLAMVGCGGMGVVLKAFDRELKRLVAIKVLAPYLAHSPVARQRFAREAQAAAAVVNPHVIAIHHVQQTGRLPFLIMPLLTGESLAQRLKARGTLELTEVLRIGMQAATGLAAAHDQGLVHRDIKPANIFLEKGIERVVITDFGLARSADDVSMTRLGVVAGTPEYMSPEQARGEALDGRSDLFSLGCVLYEMATGVSPFRGSSTIATLRRIVDEKPAAMASVNPELPPWFNEIVERLLSKDPAQRFASASELSVLLERCLSHLQQPASMPLPSCLVPQATRRRSGFVLTRKAVTAMLGTIGLILLGTFVWQSDAPDIGGPWKRIERNLESQETASQRQRFAPVVGQADKTSWTVISPPSFLSDTGWAVIARMTIGGEARIQLPEDTQPRCIIKLVEGDDQAITVQVQDAAKRSKTIVRIARDQSAEVTVDDAGYNIRYPSVSVARDQPDSSPFAQVIVKRVENQRQE